MERLLKTPPVIKPVEPGIRRPLWSVMIPTYNCLNYLRHTLESVLMQDPGEEKMQIEVIDDCSNDGDVEALVQEIGKGRIGFFKQSRNVGHHRNFETCLNRSKGELIHLLHGDDMVKFGFYNEIETLFNKYPQIGAAFTRNGYVDEEGNLSIPGKNLSPNVGIMDDFLIRIAQGQLLQVVAMVVKRSVYEKLGGFYFVNYCEDWEMWIRIGAHYPVAYSPVCLALYRGGQGHAGSITSNSLMRCDNFMNMKKVIDLAQQYLPVEKRKLIKNKAKKNYAIHIAKASSSMYQYNPQLAFIQGWSALKFHKNIKTVYWVFRLWMMHFRNKLMIKSKKLELSNA